MAELQTITPVRMESKDSNGKPAWDIWDEGNQRYRTFSTSCRDAAEKAIADGITMEVRVTPPRQEGWAPLIDLPRKGGGGGGGYRGPSPEELDLRAREAALAAAVQVVVAARAGEEPGGARLQVLRGEVAATMEQFVRLLRPQAVVTGQQAPVSRPIPAQQTSSHPQATQPAAQQPPTPTLNTATAGPLDRVRATAKELGMTDDDVMQLGKKHDEINPFHTQLEQYSVEELRVVYRMLRQREKERSGAA